MSLIVALVALATLAPLVALALAPLLGTANPSPLPLACDGLDCGSGVACEGCDHDVPSYPRPLPTPPPFVAGSTIHPAGDCGACLAGECDPAAHDARCGRYVPRTLHEGARAVLDALEEVSPVEGLCLVCGTWYGCHDPACAVLAWEGRAPYCLACDDPACGCRDEGTCCACEQAQHDPAGHTCEYALLAFDCYSDPSERPTLPPPPCA